MHVCVIVLGAVGAELVFSPERKLLILFEGVHMYIRPLLWCNVKTHQVELKSNQTEQFSFLPQWLILISTLPSVKTANHQHLFPA